MPWFQLTPASNIALIFFILSMTFMLFLLSRKEKTTATWVLTAFFGLYSLQMLSGFLWLSTSLHWQRIFDTFQGVFMLFALIGLLHFAYLFGGDIYSRERKWALRGFGLLVLAINVVNLYQGIQIAFSPDQPILFDEFPRFTLSIVSFPVALLLYGWIIVLFLRKSMHHAHLSVRVTPDQGQRKPGIRLVTGILALLSPPTAKARGMRAFGLLVILPVLFMFSIFANRAGVLEPQQHFFIASAVLCLFMMGFVVLFVNYAPERSTFQVKLVGLSLVTVMMILSTFGLTAFTDRDIIKEADNYMRDFQTLRFEPQPEGGYAMTTLDANLEITEAGERLNLRDDDNVRVELGFAFPFYGQSWSETFVSANGALSFGQPVTPEGNQVFASLRDFYNTYPKVAPFFADLNVVQQGSVTVQRMDERVLVTWRSVPLSAQSQANTFQVMLDASGVVEMRYREMAPSLLDAVVGLWPGGTEPAITPVPRRATMAVAGPGHALVDDYRATYRQASHTIVQRLTWMILLATAFIVVVFPRFFRHSLIRPLNDLLAGVQKVNAGNLDVHVEVRGQDEIGFLSMNFNTMARTLKKAARMQEQLIAMEQELSIADRIQRSTLPTTFPAFPEVEQVDLYALMRPARTVGGDFYDFFTIDERRIGFAIGDVSGKGIGAAMFMAIVRTMLHTTAMQGLAADRCVRHVNKVLYPENLAGMFVTLIYGILDVETGRVTYCNAGHNLPMLLSAKSPTYLRGQKSVALCLLPDYAFALEELQLQPGDTLLLYTDGITEAFNARQDMFSEEGLQACVEAVSWTTSEGLVHQVREAVETFTGDAEQSDDITMLALQFKGDTTPQETPVAMEAWA